MLGITRQFLLDKPTRAFSYLLAHANFAVLGQHQALGNRHSNAADGLIITICSHGYIELSVFFSSNKLKKTFTRKGKNSIISDSYNCNFQVTCDMTHPNIQRCRTPWLAQQKGGQTDWLAGCSFSWSSHAAGFCVPL